MIDARKITEGLYFSTQSTPIFRVDAIEGNRVAMNKNEGYSLPEYGLEKPFAVRVDRDILKPIPLTTEWFENLGFRLEKTNRYEDGIEYVFIHSLTYISFEDNKARIVSDTGENASLYIEYVHELQLLFAAFNIFLTLKDENNV